MYTSSAFLIVLCLASPFGVAGARLRVQRGVHGNNKTRRCEKTTKFIQIPGEPGSGLGKRGGIVADGFSRVACDVDIAPASQQISFKEHACGEDPAVKSCRLTEMGMTPRMCFDFCRQYANAKFFGLRAGRDCYCSVYFTPNSVGGQGECNAVCEGDADEMCGGMEKSSLFEMHMCQDSGSEADLAATMSEDALKAAAKAVKSGNRTAQKLQGLAQAWQLGVCSVAPEGERACAMNGPWTNHANEIIDILHETSHDADVLTTVTNSLSEAGDAVVAAGDAVNSSTASRQEVLTKDVRDVAAKLTGTTATLANIMGRIAGPINGNAKMGMKVFEALGDVKNDWFGVCALAPIAGENYAANWKDDPAYCASRCLSLSTGTKACAAFNYQFRDGIAACQLLTAEGVVEPKDSLLKAVPIFEVSKTKRDAMGIDNMGCYAHGAFLGGPMGPLKTHVVREVTA